ARRRACRGPRRLPCTRSGGGGSIARPRRRRTAKARCRARAPKLRLPGNPSRPGPRSARASATASRSWGSRLAGGGGLEVLVQTEIALAGIAQNRDDIFAFTELARQVER